MKTYGGVEYSSTLLDLSTRWRWVVSFTHLPLYPGERTPCTHYIRGSGDPRFCLENMEKRKFLNLQGLELRPLYRLTRSQSLYQLRYPGCQFKVTSRNYCRIEMIVLMCYQFLRLCRTRVSLESTADQQVAMGTIKWAVLLKCHSSRRQGRVASLKNIDIGFQRVVTWRSINILHHQAHKKITIYARNTVRKKIIDNHF
jgi:hypothetical protein